MSFIDSSKQTLIKRGVTKVKYVYTWNLPIDHIVIFDEAHRCKNKRTNNSVLLATLGLNEINILLLSATVSDKPENFIVAGFILKLFKTIKEGKYWIENVSKGYDNPMAGVHDYLYPEYASRMRTRDLGKLFPDNQILAECFDMDTAKEIEEQYNLIKNAVESLKRKEENARGLGKIMRARQRIELLKTPTFIDLAKKYLEEGLSVAIFVNFTDTLRTIADKLKTNCVIFGEQSIDERNKNI